MLIRLVSVLFALLVSACTATEFKAEQTVGTAKPVATLEVKTQSIANYLTENIRIKNIQKHDGEVVLQHPWYLPHTVTAHLEAPQTYDVTLLCEQPLKLRFEHPQATIQAHPGCYYELGCDWSNDPAEIVAKSDC